MDDRAAEAKRVHGGVPAGVRAEHGLRPVRHVLRALHDALLDVLQRGPPRQSRREGQFFVAVVATVCGGWRGRSVDVAFLSGRLVTLLFAFVFSRTGRWRDSRRVWLWWQELRLSGFQLIFLVNPSVCCSRHQLPASIAVDTKHVRPLDWFKLFFAPSRC